MALRQRSDQPNPCLPRRSLFWNQRKANLRTPSKQLRRRAPSALKFRTNWTKLHRRPNQSNPVLRRRNLAWKQRKPNLRALSDGPNRQKRKSRSLSKKAPISNWNFKRETAELQAKLDEARSEIERLKK